MRLITTTLIVLFSIFHFCLSAQPKDSTETLTFKVDGVMKNKFEFASETNMGRFSVRNSRIGISGLFTSYSSYRVQLELSDNGNFKVLDLYASIIPIKGLTISLGQTTVPLFNSYIISPGNLMFANRAFIGKYFLRTRDIGVHVDYNFNVGIVPVSAEIGSYNGNIINDPIWRDKFSYGGRLELGTMKGLRSTFKFYDYPNSTEKHYIFYGTDLRYGTDKWKIETEILKRDNKAELKDQLLSYYVQGAYAFPLKQKWIFRHLIPAVRWDAIDKNMNEGGFDINRLTVGLGLGLTKKYYSSILRFDYEWYKINNVLDILNDYDEMDSNKFTVELLLTF